MIDYKKNHVYVGKTDRAQEWAGLKDVDMAGPEYENKLIIHAVGVNNG